MSAEKAQALVLRARPFGETSAIITCLTREVGKVRGLAKGAWRPKSKFDAALDLLSICQVLVLHRSSGNLDLFTEAFLEHRFRIGRYESSFAAGLYIAELLDSVTVDADPQPELFDLATRAIRFLSAPRRPLLFTQNWASSINLDNSHRSIAVPNVSGHWKADEYRSACLEGEGSAHNADEEKDLLSQSRVKQLFLCGSLRTPSTRVRLPHSQNLRLERFVPS